MLISMLKLSVALSVVMLAVPVAAQTSSSEDDPVGLLHTDNSLNAPGLGPRSR